MTATAILQPPEQNGFLYRLLFPNGKSYIGITRRTVGQRFAEHVAFSKSNKGGNAVHHAISKYGASSVVVESLASADWDSLKIMEVEKIAQFNTRPPYGYNLTKGGEGVVGFDAVTRKKMGAANIGRTPSKETREKLSAAGTGRKHSDIARENISAGRIGIVFSETHKHNLRVARQSFVANNPPVVMSEETRARMSAAKTGLIHTDETREKLRDINTWKTHSPETRAKQSASIKASWVARKAKSESQASA